MSDPKITKPIECPKFRYPWRVSKPKEAHVSQGQPWETTLRYASILDAGDQFVVELMNVEQASQVVEAVNRMFWNSSEKQE